MSHANGHIDAAPRRFVFRIFRYAGDQDAPPRFDTFELDVPPGTTVLSALFTLQQEQDASLAFRFACRSAVCGSCAMTINGRCDLACRMQLWSLPSGEVIIEPLPNLDVIRDLVVDMTPFWDKYRRVRPWLHGVLEAAPALGSPEALEREHRQTPRQHRRIEQYINCILCACCYGACPVLKRQPEYLGPAALAKLLRFVDDSRDCRSPADWRELDGEREGLWGCDTVFRCIDACPKEVRPTDGIAALRRRWVRYRVSRKR